MLKPTHSVEELSEQSVTEQIWQKEQQEEATLHTTITLTAIPTHPLHAVTAVLQAAHHQAVLQAAVAVAQASEVHVAVAAVISEAEDKFEIKELRD